MLVQFRPSLCHATREGRNLTRPMFTDQIMNLFCFLGFAVRFGSNYGQFICLRLELCLLISTNIFQLQDQDEEDTTESITNLQK